MPYVKFTGHLRRFFPDLSEGTVNGKTVADVIGELDKRYPGLAAYIVDEQGALRKHVNIFINDELIQDRRQLQDPVSEADQLFIFQALSGG